MLRNHIEHCHISACCCSGKHKCSCFDLIRNDGVLCLMQGLHSTDLNHVCSCTTDICSHAVQEVRYIYNMWLFRYVLHDRKTVSHSCCHHYVDRCTYSHNIEIKMCSLQLFRFSKNLTIFNLYICSKCTESFQMLIDRSASDIASSRKCYFCSLVFSKKCT